jgi:hypothetical protein
MFVINLVALYSIVMFVGKARSLPYSGAPERCATLAGWSPTHKIRLG